MAEEITLSVFERNAKIYNKKGLRRSFVSIPERYTEYIQIPPLSARKNVVLEATLDKEFADEFIKFIKDNGFQFLGSINYYHLDNVCSDYELNKEAFSKQKEAIEAVKKDVALMKKDVKDYREIEDEDVVFYFLPYNDMVETLFEFIGAYKDKISEFAKEKDITVMLKIMGYCNQIDGFFGFNFFDADQKDEEVIVDYASRITVTVDFAKVYSVYSAGLLLTGIGDSEDELNAMSTHIVAENLKYRN